MEFLVLYLCLHPSIIDPSLKFININKMLCVLFHNYCNCSNTRISVLFIFFKEFSARRDNGLEKSSKCFWPNSPIDQHLRIFKKETKNQKYHKSENKKKEKKIETETERKEFRKERKQVSDLICIFKTTGVRSLWPLDLPTSAPTKGKEICS